MSSQSVKRQRYINVFVLLKDTEDINGIVKLVESLCSSFSCRYEIKKSFIDNFIYIKVYDFEQPLKEFKHRIELNLEEFKDYISWMKIEIVEIK